MVNCINLQSPIKKYVDDTGKLEQSILLNCMMDDCT
jgi:hypothetical protein